MTAATPNDAHVINASIEVEKHVTRAIPYLDALRRISLTISAFSSRYPDLAKLDLEMVALFLTMLGIMVGTYLVDFSMLSPISEFAGRSARIGTTAMALLIPITLPMLLLVIESWIANGRHQAIKQQEGAMFADTSAAKKWTLGGILFSFFVPLMNIALTRAIIAHLRAAGANDAKLSGLQLGLWVLAVFSLTGHLLIAFSGDVPKRLKSFFLYGFGASFLGTIKAIRKWRYEPLRRIARIKVIQYLHLRDQYMKAYGVFIPIGPFAQDVIAWIREEFADLTDLDDRGAPNAEP